MEDEPGVLRSYYTVDPDVGLDHIEPGKIFNILTGLSTHMAPSLQSFISVTIGGEGGRGFGNPP